eukprot:TRINITY_DN4792_c0_g1_i2.p1 TRINITY_DN4792_c0_g1~~TRINITY_DN4792_c0_g1_i2.p1  ORF type:complete len:224 (+),score=40.25 TRINITY_DN4792_c0_g1_i2:193-864(+)
MESRFGELSFGSTFCQILVCISLASIIAKELKRVINGTILGSSSSKLPCRSGSSLHGAPADIRLDACKKHSDSLRDLHMQRAGNARQDLLIKILAEATRLTTVLLPGADDEMCEEMYQAVEPALQKLDVGNSRARLAGKRFIDALQSKRGILTEAQTFHLQMTYETAVELDDLMAAAMDKHYKGSACVRAERLGDHTVASLEEMLDTEYDIMLEEAFAESSTS